MIIELLNFSVIRQVIHRVDQSVYSKFAFTEYAFFHLNAEQSLNLNCKAKLYCIKEIISLCKNMTQYNLKFGQRLEIVYSETL